MPKEYSIVFQNQHFIAVDKPTLWLSVPPRHPDERPILGRHLEVDLKCQIFPTHRLDYEVSGLILYALNSKAHKVANRIFENHGFQKTYLALSEGPEPKNDFQTWESKIVRGKKRSFEAKHGKKAITEAQFCGMKSDSLLWKLKPLTGRSHQLRFEMARRQNPIHGDELYGSQIPWDQGIALQAIQLEHQAEELSDLGLPIQLALSKESQLFAL